MFFLEGAPNGQYTCAAVASQFWTDPKVQHQLSCRIHGTTSTFPSAFPLRTFTASPGTRSSGVGLRWGNYHYWMLKFFDRTTLQIKSGRALKPFWLYCDKTVLHASQAAEMLDIRDIVMINNWVAGEAPWAQGQMPPICKLRELSLHFVSGREGGEEVGWEGDKVGVTLDISSLFKTLCLLSPSTEEDIILHFSRWLSLSMPLWDQSRNDPCQFLVTTH